MKHPTIVAIWIVSLFFAAQLVGLLMMQKYMVVVDGQFEYNSMPSFFGLPIERPEVSPTVMASLIWGGLLAGTLLVFLLLKHGWLWIWKFWYTLAVMLCLTVAFGSILSSPAPSILAFVFGLWKILRPNIIVHNLTEVLMHGGLAVIFVPVLSVKSMLVVFVLVAVYDAYAVWKSKHMIALAKFQAKSGIFAGLLVPYHIPHKKMVQKIEGKQFKLHKFRTAILGGGDITFPLLFAGVVQQEFGFTSALIITICTSGALFCLLFLGKKDRFYPAIPFLLAGALTGLGLSLLL
ncbi:MAG: hypothetical protein HY363_01000 [Candidatus Aenigmarchaeota archaeon]|nr:hypothetical protein [Candidatus Aenigmarchaeota archaeon]